MSQLGGTQEACLQTVGFFFLLDPSLALGLRVNEQGESGSFGDYDAILHR